MKAKIPSHPSHVATRRGIGLALFAALVFGLWPVATRAVYTDGGNPAFMMVLTTWMRALPLVIFCLLTKKPLFQNRASVKSAVTGGIFQSISVFGIINAVVYLPAPVAITLVFTHTLMLLFFMAWKRQIKLDAITVLTTLMALLGISFVLDFWKGAGVINPWGVILALTAAVAVMSRAYVYGLQMRDRNPAVVGAESFLIAALVTSFMPIYEMPVPPVSSAGWGWAFLGGLSLATGTFANFYGIAALGAFRFSLFLKLEPVFTALFSVLLIGEALAIRQYAGMAMVIGSLAAYQLLEPLRKKIVEKDTLST